ncbi:MAG: DUF2461 domain-containing protein [Burkholderiaceae bacterium]
MHLRDLTQFLHELEANNNRAWFVMNKPRYDILRAEFLELVIELIAGIVRFDPAIAGCNPKKALFRINRDLRFARGRDPYKTTFSAAITASGLKKPSQGGGPAYYFHIDAKGMLFSAGGEYRPPAERLRSVREHIVADAKGFGKLLKDPGLQQHFGGLQYEDRLVRLPKGFEGDAPHGEQLKLKSYIAWRTVSIAKLMPDELPALLLADFKAAAPLVKWLRTAGQTP